MSTLHDIIGGAAVFLAASLIIWLLSGGPFIWLAAHVILNWTVLR